MDALLAVTAPFIYIGSILLIAGGVAAYVALHMTDSTDDDSARTRRIRTAMRTGIMAARVGFMLNAIWMVVRGVQILLLNQSPNQVFQTEVYWFQVFVATSLVSIVVLLMGGRGERLDR